MLKIRLMRIGGRQRPFYRVVAVDERAKRTGGYIELLGTYNPLTEPKDIKLKQDRIDHWIKQGAQMSNGFLRIIGKAPQRPPRKAKKVKAESGKSEEPKQTQAEEKPTEEAPVSEASTEEVKSETPTETPAEPVIANEQSEAKQSTQIATEPEAPRDDKKAEEENTDERPA